MRQLKLILILVLLILVLLLGAGALLYLDPFGWDFALIRTKELSARESILREVRSVYRLNTVELVHKSVFPFDYYTIDREWRFLFYEEQSGEISEEDRELLAFFRFCRELGIDLNARDPGFAVVTVVAKAGFDFEGYPLAEQIRLKQQELQLHLPPPKVTELIILDPAGENYPYPGMKISPENWKRLTAYVADHIAPVIDETGLLEKARERGEELFRRLVAYRDFEGVSFSYDSYEE